MKIAFLNIYSGLVNRGAETFVEGITSKLSGKNEVYVFQIGKKIGEENHVVKTIPVEINWKKKDSTGTFKRRLFIDYWSIKVLEFTLKLVKDLLKEKFDIVIPLNGGWQPAIVRIVTWLYGGKMVISGHSGMGWDDLNNLWSFPDAFVALSSQAQKWAKKKNPFVKNFYIPNGVDLKKFSENVKDFEVKLKKPIILCVAALTKTKRVDLVIKAVSKIRNASLLIVGDGSEKDYLVSLAEELLKGRCQFLKVPYKNIQRIYKASDLFTIASEAYYSFEIVIVEAMASGLGVIVNDDPIRREIVGDAGLFVDPTNTNEYALALSKALKLDWKEKPGNQAEKFSWDKIAKDYEDLFRKIKK